MYLKRLHEEEGKVESGLDIFLKKTAVRFFYIIIGVFLLNTIFYWVEDIEALKYGVIALTILHIFLFFIPYKLQYSSIKPLIPIYLYAITILIYPILIIFWQNGQITAFLWYLLVPIGGLIFLPIKSIIRISTFVFAMICSVFFVSNIFDTTTPLSSNQITTLNILTITFLLILLIFFLYSLNKKNIIALQDLKEQEEQTVKKEALVKEVLNSEKLQEIYNQILHHFEREKPFCDPDFTILKLSLAIESNVTYVAKAIKQSRGVNFNVFVNTYRIRMVKEMIEKDFQNKYTMKYIYLSSGFKHQSTFNKVFKEIEGVTPSDYIKHKATWAPGANTATESI